MLKSIVECIIFLGRNNLAFRGHKADYKFHAEVCELSTGSVGLFQNLLNFRVSCGNDVLKRHLQTMAYCRYGRVCCLVKLRIRMIRTFSFGNISHITLYAQLEIV